MRKTLKFARQQIAGSSRQRIKTGERGYSLVAVLAVMSVMALALISAAPQLQKQQQREAELEAIARGEHVAEAIGEYIQCRARQGGVRPPNSLDDLMKEGCPTGSGLTKRRYLLRKSALHDPLTLSEDADESNWRLVAPQSRELINFSRAIAEFADGQTPQHSRYPFMQQFAPLTVQTVRGLDGDKDSDNEAAGDDDYKGPFVGVASRSKNDSIITYYGLEQHSRWLFTPAYR